MNLYDILQRLFHQRKRIRRQIDDGETACRKVRRHRLRRKLPRRAVARTRQGRVPVPYIHARPRGLAQFHQALA